MANEQEKFRERGNAEFNEEEDDLNEIRTGDDLGEPDLDDLPEAEDDDDIDIDNDESEELPDGDDVDLERAE
jgi:hypothetical protein